MFNNSKGSAHRGTMGSLCAVAAVAVIEMTSATSFGAIADITSLMTSASSGTSAAQSSISGYGASYTLFSSSNSYNLNYTGQDEAVNTVTAGLLGTYQVSTLGTVTVRRSSTGGNNDILWYVGSGGGANNANVTLDGPRVSNLNQALSSNNLLMGADNIFSNEGNTVGNDTNITRVDVVFSAMNASSTNAFSIMDRGPTNDHDAFKIAAITSLTSGGAPASYGPLLRFSNGAWGTTNLISTTQENVIRQTDGASGTTYHPSDSVTQTIGGVLIQTGSLVTPGTTIYGYSLFSADVTGSGNNLLDWTNNTYFPVANAFSNGGGLDPVSTISALYTAVPEPTSCTLATLAIGATLARRPKRAAV